MTDFICEDCGAIFDEPETLKWYEAHDGEGKPERWALPVCPVCGSEEIEEL